MLKNCNMALNISLERTASARRPEEYQINNYDTMWSNKLAAKVEDIFCTSAKTSTQQLSDSYYVVETI